MSDTKISVRVGELEFSGEGSEKWLETQLDKILEKAEELVNLAPVKSAVKNGPGAHIPHSPMAPDNDIANKALATFLRETNSTTDQTKKFLATAAWLEAKGKSRLKTGDVTQALRENSQTRLGNASQCLSNCVKKGHCERDGNQFFVTQEGKDAL